LRHQGIGPDDALVANLSPIKDDGSHTHKHFVADSACMDDRTMSHSDIVANDAGEIISQVHDSVVLNIGPTPDSNAVDVAAKDGIVPDTGVVAESNVTDHDGTLCNEDVVAQRGLFPQELVELFDDSVHKCGIDQNGKRTRTNFNRDTLCSPRQGSVIEARDDVASGVPPSSGGADASASAWDDGHLAGFSRSYAVQQGGHKDN
jgi:hypothetical protein